MQTTSKFGTGAVRSTDAEAVRYDLLSPIALEVWAQVCAEGAEKYGDWNWEKGMPVHDLLNHALRHLFGYLSGDDSEPHLEHALWNVAAAIHSRKLWPELNVGHRRAPGCRHPETVLPPVTERELANPLDVAEHGLPQYRPVYLKPKARSVSDAYAGAVALDRERGRHFEPLVTAETTVIPSPPPYDGIR